MPLGMQTRPGGQEIASSRQAASSLKGENAPRIEPNLAPEAVGSGASTILGSPESGCGFRVRPCSWTLSGRAARGDTFYATSLTKTAVPATTMTPRSICGGIRLPNVAPS